MDAEVGPSLSFEDCERERVAAAFPPAQHTIDAAFAPAPAREPPAPAPVDAGIDGADVDLETLNELPPDVRAEVERQLMLWRATRRGAARSPPPVPDAPAPKPRARSSSRSSGARPRSSSSGDAKKPAAKKTTRRKTAPDLPLRPANAADVQSFFAPKPGAAKRPRWRST